MSEFAKTAEQVHELFEKRFQAGDLDGLVSLYEDRAMIAPDRSQITTGKTGVRDALAGYLGLNGHFSTKLIQALKTDQIALLYSEWTVEGKHPDGSPLKIGGQTSDVVRKQADGTWLFVIDSPFGGGWKS